MITQNELKNLLHYDSESGLFYWLKKDSRKIAGCLRPDKYIQIAINKKQYLSHRLAWLYVYGDSPKCIDHINGDKSDNRISNLRKANQSQNLHNSKLSIKNSSGIKGISWNKARSKWAARVCINYTNKHIGYFDDIELARVSICKARVELHGDFARNI
jgi:hypothetical protein